MKVRTDALVIFLTLFIYSCTNNKFEKRKIDNSIVEAKFIDNKINGVAKFYSPSGFLEYEGNYTQGLKNGFGKIFYSNGKTKDSMNYVNDLIHGNAYQYDSIGNLRFVRTNFYGIEIGGHFFYDKGKIFKYFFDSFEGVEIVNCTYDSMQRCESIFYKMAAIVKNISLDNDRGAKKVFVYFPHPPGFEVIYKLSNTRSSPKISDEVILNSDRLFLDTVLNVSAEDSYLLSVDFLNKSNDSVVKVLRQKL